MTGATVSQQILYRWSAGSSNPGRVAVGDPAMIDT